MPPSAASGRPAEQNEAMSVRSLAMRALDDLESDDDEPATPAIEG